MNSYVIGRLEPICCFTRIFVTMILFRKIANVSLALLLLVATTGVTLNKHYCMGRLKSIAVFEAAHSCSENGAEDPMPCCKDVSEQMKVNEITKVSFDFKSAPDLYPVAVICFFVLSQDLLSVKNEKPQHRFYSPPLPDQNLQVLNQNFLI